MDFIWSMGSMVSTSNTVVSGIHWQHAEWHHTPSVVVRFRAPPSTGHNTHSGVSETTPPVCSHAAHSHLKI